MANVKVLVPTKNQAQKHAVQSSFLPGPMLTQRCLYFQKHTHYPSILLSNEQEHSQELSKIEWQNTQLRGNVWTCTITAFGKKKTTCYINLRTANQTDSFGGTRIKQYKVCVMFTRLWLRTLKSRTQEKAQQCQDGQQTPQCLIYWVTIPHPNPWIKNSKVRCNVITLMENSTSDMMLKLFHAQKYVDYIELFFSYIHKIVIKHTNFMFRLELIPKKPHYIHAQILYNVIPSETLLIPSILDMRHSTGHWMMIFYWM